MGTSAVKRNTPDRYNAQPYQDEPKSNQYERQMEHERGERSRRWYENPKNKGCKPPAHILHG